MNNKVIIGLVIAGIVVVGGIVGAAYFSQPQSGNTDSSSSSSSQSNEDGEFVKTTELSDSEAPKYLTAEDGTNIRGQADATGQKEVAVEMADFFYSPSVLTVSKGTTVTWTNTGGIGHTVTSEEDSSNQVLESKLLQQGDSYSYTFDETGTFNYFCEPHPTSMKAVVEVVE